MMSRKQIVFFFLFCAFAAAAEEIPSTLSNFTSGTTISSSTMNAHFDAVETAVDDNASDIDALQALFTGSDANTALALAANGSNCPAGEYPLGVGADGAVESCTDATTEIVTVAAALVNAKSAATSTDNAVPKFDSTAGDVQNSGVTIDDSNNLTVPGAIRGAASTETTSSTSHTLSSAQGQWLFADESGATQIDLPAVSAGANVCVYSTTAQVISLNPSGSENIFLDGATIGAGDELDSPGEIGDFICLLSNGTNWYVLGIDGAWVDGGAS